MSESSGRTESEGLGRSVSMVVDTFVDESVRRNIAVSIHITLVDRDSLGELEYKLKSNKRLDWVVWTAEYDGIMNKTLHDYDLEMFEKARNTRAAKTRRIKVGLLYMIIFSNNMILTLRGFIRTRTIL
ncbi:uncharacterized protein OCT59_004311 [Rhizophagus irregularis]|uniref:uncharacterized protein n=1 Tax=Rhizophagus irregularis TaxID=588596 RepID=UPI0019E88131|nr:hypothetical protein OCT59_004311 [Rhizophagus irregularis]GBC53883.2 hypothetical protein GLOIN_2v1789063 [Rhizophagus irregularis DAOM 181602=DAOM 197198]